jgi:hypothetical protein
MMGGMAFETVSYGGWARCYRLANEKLELLVTGEVGPRILRLARAGGPNLFHEVPEHLGKTGGETWRSYGGHRLWHAPEAQPRSYQPDNTPPEIEEVPGGLRVRQPTEVRTGVAKEMTVTLHRSAPLVTVTHRLANRGLWPIRLAPWALSVMRAGGVAVIPLPPRSAHPDALLPSSTLTLWPYTDLSDPRYRWGRRYVQVRQDASATTPQKVGASVPDGWCAYVHEHGTFLKVFVPERGEYPDLGSMVEVFTNAAMLELETLAPLTVLGPGESVAHVEHWYVSEGAELTDDAGGGRDGAVADLLLPLVAAAREALAQADGV